MVVPSEEKPQGVVRIWGLYTIFIGEGEREKGSGKTNDFLVGVEERTLVEDK